MRTLGSVALVLVALAWPVAASSQSRAAPWVDEHDTDGDGVIDWRVTIWSGPAGIEREEIDENADGVIDEVVVGTYDARGAPLSWSTDVGADGTWDRQRFYGNDARGRRTSAEGDLDGDGTREVHLTFDPPCEAPYDGCDVVPSC